MRRVSNGHRYDPEMDRMTWRGFNPAKFANKNKDPLKKAFALGKMKATISVKATKAKSDKDRKQESRETAEANAADAIERAVSILEFSLAELSQAEAPRSYTKKVNQLQIADAIRHLKFKCLVHRT